MTNDEIEFHRHTHGAGVEDRFFLTRDGSSGHLFIRQQWASDPTEDARGGDGNLSIADFLRGDGERQAALITLIGSLIPKPNGH